MDFTKHQKVMQDIIAKGKPMNIKEQIAKIEELYKSQGCYYYSGDDMPVHVDDCRLIGCVSCIIKTILAIPELAALLETYYQAGGEISRLVVKADSQTLPKIPEFGYDPDERETEMDIKEQMKEKQKWTLKNRWKILTRR